MKSFLSALADRGLSARLVNGKLKLHPGSLVTPELAEKIRAHLPAIVAELQPPADMPSLAAACEAQQAASAQPLDPSPWADLPGKPLHDLDRLSEVFVALFARCAALGWEGWQYWEPPMPRPSERPYCYVRSILIDAMWLYMPMLAEVDGIDYLWALD